LYGIEISEFHIYVLYKYIHNIDGLGNKSFKITHIWVVLKACVGGY